MAAPSARSGQAMSQRFFRGGIQQRARRFREFRRSQRTLAPRRPPRVLTLPNECGGRGRESLEANVAYDVSAFVLDHIGTFGAFESRLGVLITKRRSLLVVRFGSA